MWWFNIHSFFFFGRSARLAGSYFPDQGLNLCPQPWKHGVLTIGPPGNSLTSHSFVCLFICFSFLWWELLRSTLSKYRVYDTLLLIIITMLYISSPELIHLITESLYPLTNISPYPLHLPISPTSQCLATTILIFGSVSSTFLDSTYKWDHTTFVFCGWLISLNVLQVHPCWCKWHDFFFYGWIIFLCVCVCVCVCVSHFLYPFIGQWIDTEVVSISWLL